MGGLIGAVALAAILFWLFGPRRRRDPAPEDDVTTPVDQDELAQAEDELGEDHGARSLDDGFDDDTDDWGPGTA